MKIESGKIEGNLRLDKELHLTGMVTGNIEVIDGGYIQLDGTTGGDVVVNTNATAIVNGTINGNAINNGGKLEIFGVVSGNVKGATFVDKKSVVKGSIDT